VNYEKKQKGVPFYETACGIRVDQVEFWSFWDFSVFRMTITNST